jgi:hypothetical protein
MSYYYSARDIEGMRAAGILRKANAIPSSADLDLISRNHKCSECGGSVRYVPVNKMKRTESDPYQFICDGCGHIARDMPLKKVR